MQSHRFFNLLVVFGTTLVMMGTLLYFNQAPLIGKTAHSSYVSQNVNDYFGPHTKVAGLINVQILISDDPSLKENQIESVTFNGTSIPLKPRDVYGFRGQGSFQLRPGKYRLVWKVKRDNFDWPRDNVHTEEVTIDPRDLWIQISIVGDNATIS